MKQPKMLAICSGIDLRRVGGCVPAFWQLFKALHELKAEVIVTPYYGDEVQSKWWRSYSNPNRNLLDKFATSVYRSLSNITRYESQENIDGHGSRPPLQAILLNKVRKNYIRFRWKVAYSKWKKHLETILKKEKEVDAIVLFSIPLNQLHDLPCFVHKCFDLPVVVYEADFVTYLWSDDDFLQSSYYGVNLQEYDAFVVNSEGIIPKLKQLGARNVEAIHFGADPDIFSPLNVKQDIDVSFYGFGSLLRKTAIEYMISKPTRVLQDAKFAVMGCLNINVGLAKNMGNLTFGALRSFCCRSKINLNITRETFAKTYGTSTSRPFELASLACCIVSNPCAGLEGWFNIGKEIYVVRDQNEAVETYKWLLSSDDLRREMGRRARQRVLKEHTYLHRANQFLALLNRVI